VVGYEAGAVREPRWQDVGSLLPEVYGVEELGTCCLVYEVVLSCAKLI